MGPQTLYDKLWASHVVHAEDDGTTLVYIDRHLVHEVTSPQAYEGLKLASRKVWRPGSVVATADHNTPTRDWHLGIADPTSRAQVDELDRNIATHGAMPDVNLQYAIAVALIDGTVSFEASHSYERMKDPAIQSVKQRITLIGERALMDPAAPRSGCGSAHGVLLLT